MTLLDEHEQCIQVHACTGDYLHMQVTRMATPAFYMQWQTSIVPYNHSGGTLFLSGKVCGIPYAPRLRLRHPQV